MTQTLEAVFDGEVLRPLEPLDLQPNTRVLLTIKVKQEKEEAYAFLRVARSLNLEGPPDWSTRVDEYLYGDIEDAAD